MSKKKRKQKKSKKRNPVSKNAFKFNKSKVIPNKTTFDKKKSRQEEKKIDTDHGDE